MTEQQVKISVNNVSKKFFLDYQKHQSALGSFIDLISGKKKEKKLEVLKKISFEVKKAEVVGIIGKNGCGKSTLLKIISGIYQPDTGVVSLYGKASYLSGFGYGLMPKLTMRDNIFFIGSIMGLSQADVKKIFNKIVEFSNLKDFIDVKVYQFSSGMLARLNFSVIIHCLEHHNPDIILLDEVFGSGGDMDFQEKVIKKMEELIGNGSSVIIVSHNSEIIKKYCHRAILLDAGIIKKEGLPDQVQQEYKRIIHFPSQ